MPIAQIHKAPPSDPFVVATCARVGKPPFRFNGQCLAHNEVLLGSAAGAPPATVRISLWQRARGGFTLSYSVWSSEGWREDAQNAASIDVAIDLLEKTCGAQSAALLGAGTGPASPAEQIEQLAYRQHARTTYHDLVGRALERWTELATMTAPTRALSLKVKQGTS